jgi:hypothetical protein
MQQPHPKIGIILFFVVSDATAASDTENPHSCKQTITSSWKNFLLENEKNYIKVGKRRAEEEKEERHKGSRTRKNNQKNSLHPQGAHFTLGGEMKN